MPVGPAVDATLQLADVVGIHRTQGAGLLLHLRVGQLGKLALSQNSCFPRGTQKLVRFPRRSIPSAVERTQSVAVARSNSTHHG